MYVPALDEKSLHVRASMLSAHDGTDTVRFTGHVERTFLELAKVLEEYGKKRCNVLRAVFSHSLGDICHPVTILKT